MKNPQHMFFLLCVCVCVCVCVGVGGGGGGEGVIRKISVLLGQTKGT